jgi:argininosuccinate lyase
VRRALDAGKTLSELTLDELRAEAPELDAGVYQALEPETAIERRALLGGPARAFVQAELDAWHARLRARDLVPEDVARRFGVAE